MDAERLDERALPDARNAAHADAGGAARVRQEELEQALRVALVVGTRALDERDRLRERAAIAAPDAGGELVDAARRWRHSPPLPRAPPRAAARGARPSGSSCPARTPPSPPRAR